MDTIITNNLDEILVIISEDNIIIKNGAKVRYLLESEYSISDDDGRLIINEVKNEN